MQGPQQWQPEDPLFWEMAGRRVAARNLRLLTASLFCGFAVWTYWSVITVQMLQLGFAYSVSELYSLIAIAGLAGGSLRITLGFLTPANGARQVLFLGTVLLLVPVLGTGVALGQADTPLWLFQLLALWSGVGGGCFSAFVAAINELFPRKRSGLALNLGAGLGHLGVAAAQILIPLVATFAVWGALSGEPRLLNQASSTWLGSIASGESLWIQHASYVWLLFLLPLLLLLPFGAGGIRHAVNGLLAVKFAAGLTLGLTITALGLWLMLPPEANGGGLGVSRELGLAIILAGTVMSLRLLPSQMTGGLEQVQGIFNNKHTWVMSVLCAMSLGSFLGFATALPLTLELVFGYTHSPASDSLIRTANPNAPGIFTYIWLGPLLGVIMRPVGGWLADRFGGARVTEVAALTMAVGSVGAAYYFSLAYNAPEPERHFLPLLLIFFAIFAAAGAGHTSVLHTMLRLFPHNQLMWINIWTSAIAAYGVFYIPQAFSQQLSQGAPAQAMIGFAAFYVICFFLNRWFYLRRDSAFFNR